MRAAVCGRAGRRASRGMRRRRERASEAVARAWIAMAHYWLSTTRDFGGAEAGHGSTASIIHWRYENGTDAGNGPKNVPRWLGHRRENRVLISAFWLRRSSRG